MEIDVVGDAPFVLASPEVVVGMAVYSAGTMLDRKGHDVWEMLVENVPWCGAALIIA